MDKVNYATNAKRKIDQAVAILRALGLPKEQQNDRSALTLLALLDLKPSSRWKQAGAPLLGITPIMEFIRNHYPKIYAPNSRETVRRYTIRQFVQAGIVIPNPDHNTRPINSPDNVYQIEPDTLKLLMTFGTKSWKNDLLGFLSLRPTLVAKYAKKRTHEMIPLTISGKTIQLSPGAHSQSIKVIIEQFATRFATGAEVLYIGKTSDKMILIDENTFKQIGLVFDKHGKFPDVVLLMKDKNWLLLIESVTSHGLVDSKRHIELLELFTGSTAGLVFVTAFPDRKTMAKYLGVISWETEVWVADSPDHLIHFNGERFLGPYKK